MPLVNIQGYDRHLQLHLEFPIIFILVPIMMFLLYWQVIQRVFKTNFWMIKSLLVIIAWTLILFKGLSLDRSIIDNSYRFSFKERLDIIDNELNKAKTLGLKISPETKSILEKFHTESKLKMMGDIRSSFKSNKAVSLDTLVLAKIIITNLDHVGNFPVEVNNEEKWDLMWMYPFPEDVYRQLKFHDPKDIETKVIFEMLSEMINISNSRFRDSQILNENLDPYFQNQKYERIVLISNTITIQSRLIQVVQKLLSNEAYQNYHPLINDMVFELDPKRHKWVDLDLGDLVD